MSFKGRAKNWDNENRIKRSLVVSNKIAELVGKQKNRAVMEYGCATGLVSFNLVDKFTKLTLMDSEKEMIDIVKEKIKIYGTSKVSPITIDLTKENYTEEKFDIIYT